MGVSCGGLGTYVRVGDVNIGKRLPWRLEGGPWGGGGGGGVRRAWGLKTERYINIYWKFLYSGGGVTVWEFGDRYRGC